MAAKDSFWAAMAGAMQFLNILWRYAKVHPENVQLTTTDPKHLGGMMLSQMEKYAEHIGVPEDEAQMLFLGIVENMADSDAEFIDEVFVKPGYVRLPDHS